MNIEIFGGAEQDSNIDSKEEGNRDVSNPNPPLIGLRKWETTRVSIVSTDENTYLAISREFVYRSIVQLFQTPKCLKYGFIGSIPFRSRD